MLFVRPLVNIFRVHFILFSDARIQTSPYLSLPKLTGATPILDEEAKEGNLSRTLTQFVQLGWQEPGLFLSLFDRFFPSLLLSSRCARCDWSTRRATTLFTRLYTVLSKSVECLCAHLSFRVVSSLRKGVTKWRRPHSKCIPSVQIFLFCPWIG